MMGSFVTRTLLLALGYAYPAYECFKTVERNKPEIEQLRFWCQYWILVAALTVFERVGDTFVSWVPMYSEAKLAFFIYLWYPKTRGTTFVYESFLRPYVTKHETEIDRNLLELRTKARDIIVLYWQKAAAYGQTRIFEILQFIASQSQSQPSRPQRNRQQQQQIQQQQGHQTPPPIPAPQPDVAQKQAQPPIPNQPSSPVKSHTCEPAQKPVTAAQAGLATQVQATTSSSSVSIAEVPDSVVPSNSGAGPSKSQSFESEIAKIEVTNVAIGQVSNAFRVSRVRMRKPRVTGSAKLTRRNWFFWRVTGEESRDVKDQHED